MYRQQFSACGLVFSHDRLSRRRRFCCCNKVLRSAEAARMNRWTAQGADWGMGTSLLYSTASVPETQSTNCRKVHPRGWVSCAVITRMSGGVAKIVMAHIRVPNLFTATRRKLRRDHQQSPLLSGGLHESDGGVRGRISTSHESTLSPPDARSDAQRSQYHKSLCAAVTRWGPRVSAASFPVCEVSTGPRIEYGGKPRHRDHLAAPGRYSPAVE